MNINSFIDLSFYFMYTVCMYVYVFIYLSLFMYLFIYLFIYLFTYIFIYLFIYLPNYFLINQTNLQTVGGAQTDLTHLEFIHFWIASLVAHASPPPGRENHISPKIFIVGTHRDSLPDMGIPKEEYVSMKHCKTFCNHRSLFTFQTSLKKMNTNKPAALLRGRDLLVTAINSGGSKGGV